MKARAIRFLFGLHRWTGVALGLLMLMWCLSGFVMMYVPYPATSLDGRDFRREGLAPIALPDVVALPSEAIPADAKVSSARVEMLGDRPVLALAWTDGRGLFDLSTGAAIDAVDEAEALDVAQVYAARHGLEAAPEIARSMERDEFVVAGYFNSARPFWEAHLGDADKTTLYIASTTGEIRQRTTAFLRFWNWLGAIPHWLYFTELRKDGKLWTDVVIWTSLGGCFLTVLGLFVGLRQFRRRTSTGKFASPYRGAKFLHHMLGLTFGVLVLTWTFSGFASMQPWGWLESGDEAGAAVERLGGEAPVWSEVAPALVAQAYALRRDGARDVAQIVSAQSDGAIHFVRVRSDGVRERFDASGTASPFDAAAWARAGELLAGDKGAAEVELLEREDAYFYKGAASGRLPVLRVTVPEAEATRYYLDPVSAQVVAVADPGARGFRWLHLGLHRMDFFGWLRARPVWDIVVWALMLGVTGVCALGAWMGLRKLARGGRLDGLPKD